MANTEHFAGEPSPSIYSASPSRRRSYPCRSSRGRLPSVLAPTSPGCRDCWCPRRSTCSRNDVGVAQILPVVARHLNPLAILEFRDLVHLDLVHAHRAVFVADPKIDVVDLVLGAEHAKVGAGEEMAVIVELPNGLVGVDELQIQHFAGLVILEFEHAAIVRALRERTLLDCRHHFPTALVRHVARMLRGGNPPPRDWLVSHCGPGALRLPRFPVDPDLLNLELPLSRCHPEIDQVFLLRIRLVRS